MILKYRNISNISWVFGLFSQRTCLQLLKSQLTKYDQPDSKQRHNGPRHYQLKVDQSLSLPGNNVDCADDEYGKVGCAE